jgi:hypothetical protein
MHLQILSEDFIQGRAAEARGHTSHLPRLPWVTLSSVLFTRVGVLYFSRCHSHSAMVCPTHRLLSFVTMQAEVAQPGKGANSWRRRGVATGRGGSGHPAEGRVATLG